ncbi:MAG: hypothetical protein AABW65_00555 [Nanoarchaeota archaeon]
MTLYDIGPTSWGSMTQSEKNITYCALTFIAGLIALDVYFRPKMNETAHQSLDSTIQRYDTNRDGEIQGGELELLAKDLRDFQLK